MDGANICGQQALFGIVAVISAFQSLITHRTIDEPAEYTEETTHKIGDQRYKTKLDVLTPRQLRPNDEGEVRISVQIENLTNPRATGFPPLTLTVQAGNLALKPEPAPIRIAAKYHMQSYIASSSSPGDKLLFVTVESEPCRFSKRRDPFLTTFSKRFPPLG
jgi:hypothetical protein